MKSNCATVQNTIAQFLTRVKRVLVQCNCANCTSTCATVQSIYIYMLALHSCFNLINLQEIAKGEIC